jgi:adenylate cyclase
MALLPLSKYRAASLAIGAACLLAAVLLSWTPIVRLVELKTLDMCFAMRGPIEQSPDIFHIDIDDASIDELGRWPWSRDVHATLIEGLALMGARAIVFDVEFIDPQPPYERDGAKIDPDERLAAASRGFGRVYLTLGFHGKKPRPRVPYVERSSSAPAPKAGDIRTYEQMVMPIETLTQEGAAFRYGSVDVPDPDPDGIYRRIPILFQYGDRIYFYLGALAALDRLGADPTEASFDGAALRAGGKVEVPLDAQGRLLLNWPVTGPAGYQNSFQHLPYVTALRACEKFIHGEMRPDSPYVRIQEKIEGKICFVGAFARSLADIKPAPNSPLMPGVSVHSTVANMILTGSYLRELPWALSWLAAALLGAASISLCAFGRPLHSGAGICLGFALWLCATYFAFLGGRVLPVALPCLMLVLPFAGILPYRLATEEKTRGQVLRTFQRFLDPAIVEEIIRKPEVLKEDARRIKASVMFTDIEGFSSFAENTPPEVTVKVLNVYLTLVTETIVSYQGYLDKYLGDGTMAIFGLRPGLQPELAAESACRAALEIRKKTKEQSHMYPFGRTRIGITSGDVVSGFIGGVEGNLDFTAIGDAVNVAARLQALNKEKGTQILIDERTFKLIQGKIPARFVETVQIRGRKEEAKIYTIDPEGANA